MEIAYVGNMFVVDTTCQNIVNINKLILVFKTIFCLFKEYCLYIFGIFIKDYILGIDVFNFQKTYYIKREESNIMRKWFSTKEKSFEIF